MGSRDEDATTDASPGCRGRARSSRFSRSPACASSFMFTLMVPIQSKLPELLDASREDTAWVVTVDPARRRGHHPDLGAPRRHVRQAADRAGAARGAWSSARSSRRSRPGIIGIIVGRTLQGAIVGVVPLGISIMRDVLHENRVDSAIAFMSATLGVGGALGLPISALVTERSDWHVLFWMAAGLGVVVLRARAVDRAGERAAHRRAASTSSAPPASRSGSSASCSPSRAATSGAGARPPCWPSGSAGSSCCSLWGWFELRIDEPLLDLRVAARPAGAADEHRLGRDGLLAVRVERRLPADARAAGRDRRRVRAVAAGREPDRHAVRPRDDGALARRRAHRRAHRARSSCCCSAPSRSSPRTASRCCSRPRCGTSSSRTS